VPMANATVINPADGTENTAAPHTEVTSINVPINSAINLRVIVPASSKRSASHVPKGIRRRSRRWRPPRAPGRTPARQTASRPRAPWRAATHYGPENVLHEPPLAARPLLAGQHVDEPPE